MASGSSVVRVLIVDDHQLFGRTLELLLEGEDGIDVVGRAYDGEEGIRLAGELDPDVVLMDIGMPGISGLEATRRIAEANGATAILVLSGSSEAKDGHLAVESGAVGFMLKDRALFELAPMIRELGPKNGSRRSLVS
jgi:DNA-binding NarL/FixJ family response regulator